MKGNRVHFKIQSNERFVDSCLRKAGLREKSVERPQRLTYQDEEFESMSPKELREKYQR